SCVRDWSQLTLQKRYEAIALRPRHPVSATRMLDEIMDKAELGDDGRREHERMQFPCAHRSAHAIDGERGRQPRVHDRLDAGGVVGIEIDMRRESADAVEPGLDAEPEFAGHLQGVDDMKIVR